MQKWRTTLEVAKFLNVSKDVVKYHRKKLSPLDVLKSDGKYVISEAGVAQIKSMLRKESYSLGFEEKVLERLRAIEGEISLLRAVYGSRIESLQEAQGTSLTASEARELSERLEELLERLRAF